MSDSLDLLGSEHATRREHTLALLLHAATNVERLVDLGAEGRQFGVHARLSGAMTRNELLLGHLLLLRQEPDGRLLLLLLRLLFSCWRGSRLLLLNRGNSGSELLLLRLLLLSCCRLLGSLIVKYDEVAHDRVGPEND